uniref:DH domain-containing protein n=1 Tax=Steinernema glaseri TaxID=37863 RepID=A0A1I7Y0M1_9BILA
MSSSLCAYRRSFLALPKTTASGPPRFSWTSTALKSIYGDEVPQNTSASTASNDRFLETKQQDRVNPIAEGESSGKPYGDDAIELSTDEEGHHGWNHADTESEEERDGRVVLTAKRDLPHDQADEMKALRESFLKTHYPNEVMTDSSEDEDDEALEQRHIASIIRPANISVSMLAGDGNPVRHSLVNLVLEEDLPMLMEAMSEECNVVFDDYTDSTTASTSSIIHAPNERRERRRQRNVDHRG